MPPTVAAYQPASFFLTTVTGAAGFGIGVGQAFAGAPSCFEHAGMILDEYGTILEAEPGGARIANIREYAGRPLLVCDGPVEMAAATPPANWLSNASMTYEQWLRSQVVAAAQQLVGVPYSAADYLALALLHLHLPSGWIRRRVESSGHLICSALVDRAYMNAGVHLFDDGRLPGDVMPSDLAAWAEDHS